MLLTVRASESACEKERTLKAHLPWRIISKVRVIDALYCRTVTTDLGFEGLGVLMDRKVGLRSGQRPVGYHASREG